MRDRGYDEDFAYRLFEQIKGFGGYGFPESHSASFALLCYFSSWLKCHHPAAFYCALLNSQPMGFYSPSQLIQDAKRHQVPVYPVDINDSAYENCLTPVPWNKKDNTPLASPWGIRLGFCRVKSLNHVKAKNIATLRQQQPFTHINELSTRAQLSKADIKALAAADALYELAGHRYQAHWQAAAIEPELPLFSAAHAQIQTKTPIHEQAPSHKQRSNHEQIPTEDKLCTSAPTLQNDIFADYQSTGHSLRPHLMALLRQQAPFSRCKTCRELTEISNGRFVQVAGLVTGRQRPGTAKGTVFVTLEDESGNINVVVWPQTQDLYRQALLQSKLLLVKGRLETKDSVTHIIAGQLHDYSERIQALQLKSRDFH